MTAAHLRAPHTANPAKDAPPGGLGVLAGMGLRVGAVTALAGGLERLAMESQMKSIHDQTTEACAPTPGRDYNSLNSHYAAADSAQWRDWAMSQGRALTAPARARFLDELARTCNVTASAAAIGVHRNTLYDHKAADPEFAAAWSSAIEAATDALEAEARRRAMEGTQEYLTCKDGLIYDEHGKPVMQRRYSDTLMVQLLRAHRPERFRDTAASATAAVVNITVSSDDAAL